MKQKTSLADLLKYEKAGGILTESVEAAYTLVGYNSWDEYVNDVFDMNDPELVAFIQTWKNCIDAKAALRDAIAKANISTGLDK
jgi:hypothetical protein